jgi:hypothetical protein
LKAAGAFTASALNAQCIPSAVAQQLLLSDLPAFDGELLVDDGIGRRLLRIGVSSSAAFPSPSFDPSRLMTWLE